MFDVRPVNPVQAISLPSAGVFMNLVIIANPRAGRGDRRAQFARYAEELGALGLDARFELTRGPGDGVRLAREAAAEADVVGVLGGDGSLHEVVNGVMANPRPIVLLPSGSGNDFASLVACPRNPAELVEVVREGYGCRVDVVEAGDRYAINTIGIGFEGLVNEYSHKVRLFKGPALYMYAVFRALASLECPDLRITTSAGERYDGRKLLVSIGNGRRTGGAFYLLPDAYPDDGLIDVCLVEAMGRLSVVRLLPRSLSGRHVDRPEVTMLRVASLAIESDHGFPMHVDGEFVRAGAGTLDVRLHPLALTVLCKRAGAHFLKHPVEKVL